MTDYVTQAGLETYLGRPLTAAELANLPIVAPAATRQVDAYTGRSWQGVAVTTRRPALTAPFVRLDHAPVASIESVRTRAPAPGAAWTVLAEGDGYELLDPDDGLLTVSTWYGWMVEVGYTSGTALPEAARRAAEMLAAGMLASASAVGSSTAGGGGRIRSFSVDGESVEYADAGGSGIYAGGLDWAGGSPPEVRALLDPLTVPAVVA